MWWLYILGRVMGFQHGVKSHSGFITRTSIRKSSIVGVADLIDTNIGGFIK